MAASIITKSEVAKHNKDGDCWIIINGKVYDPTTFLNDHPGGAGAILGNAGKDATDDFEAFHSDDARTILANYYIGDLGEETDSNSVAATESSSPAPGSELVALDPKQKITVVLQSKEVISHDTRRFRFALASPQHKLGLPIGNHVYISANVNGEPCTRPYTPTSGAQESGYFDLVIKVYFKNVHPRFPDGGKMSQHLDSLSIGDTIEVKGPVGHVSYLGRGKFLLAGKEKTAMTMGFICGGTGITPAYQVIKAVLSDPSDTTVCRLLYANQTPADILLREDLDRWAAEHADRFTVHYTVDRIPEGTDWAFSIGHINEALVRAHIPAPAGSDAFVGLCGPPPMVNMACIPNLKLVGYSEDCFFSF